MGTAQTRACSLPDMAEHSMTQRLKELAARREEARHAGSARAVERQHAQGKMTARERIEYLLDEGSFQELDMLARHPAHGGGLHDHPPSTHRAITGRRANHRPRVGRLQQA